MVLHYSLKIKGFNDPWWSSDCSFVRLWMVLNDTCDNSFGEGVVEMERNLRDQMVSKLHYLEVVRGFRVSQWYELSRQRHPSNLSSFKFRVIQEVAWLIPTFTYIFHQLDFQVVSRSVSFNFISFLSNFSTKMLLKDAEMNLWFWSRRKRNKNEGLCTDGFVIFWNCSKLLKFGEVSKDLKKVWRLSSWVSE